MPKPTDPVKAELWKQRLSASHMGIKPWNLGVSRSEATKAKISLANKGRKRTPEQVERLRLTVVGRKHSEESKAKIRESNIGKNSGKFIGDKSPRWNPDKTKTQYPLGWTHTFKEQIRNRDGYKCQECGKHEVESMRRHDVHHIDYIKDNLDPQNLITLCRSCHIKTNTKRAFWTNHFDLKRQVQCA